ncbi:MAG: nitrate/nitrite transporter NrtS [Acidimicrobiales bacterium]
MRTGPEPPTWSVWREAVGVVLYPPHLRSTLSVAVVVGTVLFCINQLDVVLRGDATAVVWFKSALTYVVPFFVSNVGVLVATLAPQGRDVPN